MKKTLHIIPHTHWDREWYMSFENHRFRLVKFMDELLQLMQNDSEYRYFHLDGQMILLQDYLEIRPENEFLIKEMISEGRLQIGPWYVLSDEYLVSGEAHIRNLMIGISEAKKYGEPVYVGYLPDAFGNIAQMPQILKGFGIDYSVYGRGRYEIIFDNEIQELNEFDRTEHFWESPDGSKVIAARFPTWYHNGNEIPSDIKKAKIAIEQAGDAASAYSELDHLLIMNGSDHQPVQKDLHVIISKLNRECKFEVLHSNFSKYFSEIIKRRNSLKTVKGEMCSQFTKGYGTLVNTASSRVDIKKLNYDAQRMLENIVEPLGVMSMINGFRYDSEYINYAWKLLLQNHPHDSICNCSVDEVHDEMILRYKKVLDISNNLADESAKSILSQINTSDNFDVSDVPLVVFNCYPKQCFQPTEIVIDLPLDKKIENYSLFDKSGEIIEFYAKEIGEVFHYELPENSFRKIKYINRYNIYFIAHLPAYGYETFKLAIKQNELTESNLALHKKDNRYKNKYFDLDINKSGEISIVYLKTGKKYKNLNIFEDTGDIGNEYEYIGIKKDERIMSNNKSVKIEEIFSCKSFTIIKVTQELKLPKKSNISKKIRSKTYITTKISSLLTLYADINRLDIKTTINNKSEDHRLRVLFETDLESSNHFADSQFEVIERQSKPWSGRENPSFCQRQQSFVGIENENEGLIIANRGIPEYEILYNQSNSIALTLIRSVGELGDWGFFPTPGSQMKSEYSFEYSIIPFEKSEKTEMLSEAYLFSKNPYLAKQGDIHNGKMPLSNSYMKIKDNLFCSSIKKSESDSDFILRIYNPLSRSLHSNIFVKNVVSSKLLMLNESENKNIDVSDDELKVKIKCKEIKTIKLKTKCCKKVAINIE